MNRIIPSLFLILCTYLIVSCSKDNFECSSANTVNIPQVMKDYFYYKEGTWWVYKNVKNNTYDSLWVSNVNLYNNRGEGKEGFGNPDNCYERIAMGIKQSGADSVSKFYLWDLSNFDVDNNNRFAFGVFGRDILTNVEWDFNLLFANSQLETYNPVRNISSIHKDSITLNGNTYINLIEVTGSNFIHYWLFSKQVGLVKYIDRDSNQWELIRYNINQ